MKIFLLLSVTFCFGIWTLFYFSKKYSRQTIKRMNISISLAVFFVAILYFSFFLIHKKRIYPFSVSFTIAEPTSSDTMAFSHLSSLRFGISDGGGGLIMQEDYIDLPMSIQQQVPQGPEGAVLLWCLNSQPSEISISWNSALTRNVKEIKGLWCGWIPNLDIKKIASMTASDRARSRD